MEHEWDLTTKRYPYWEWGRGRLVVSLFRILPGSIGGRFGYGWQWAFGILLQPQMIRLNLISF